MERQGLAAGRLRVVRTTANQGGGSVAGGANHREPRRRVGCGWCEPPRTKAAGRLRVVRTTANQGGGSVAGGANHHEPRSAIMQDALRLEKQVEEGGQDDQDGSQKRCDGFLMAQQPVLQGDGLTGATEPFCARTELRG